MTCHYNLALRFSTTLLILFTSNCSLGRYSVESIIIVSCEKMSINVLDLLLLVMGIATVRFDCRCNRHSNTVVVVATSIKWLSGRRLDRSRVVASAHLLTALRYISLDREICQRSCVEKGFCFYSAMLSANWQQVLTSMSVLLEQCNQN